MVLPLKNRYLLINGLSGAVKLVSNEIAQKFFDGEVLPEIKPFFTYLTPEEEDEKARSLCTFLLNAVQCVDGNIAITFDCNLRCPYCFEIWAKGSEIKGVTMDEHKVDKAYEGLEQLNKDCSKTKVVTLTGGEPLMTKNRDIVKYFLRKGSTLGYTFAVITNGVELNSFLSDLSSVDVNHIQVTLDGPPSLHDKRRIYRKGEGTFHQIIQNMEEAREMGLRLVIRTNVDGEILSHIEELARFFKERGWADDPEITFSLNALNDPHMEPGRTRDYIWLYEEAFQKIRNPELHFLGVHEFVRHFRRLHPLCRPSLRFWPAFWHCSAGITRFVFDPFGDVHPCPSMIGWREQRIGVYVPELSFNKNYEKWRNRSILALKKCAGCNIKLICGGECGYASIMREKDLFSPVCTITEKLLVDYLEAFMESE